MITDILQKSASQLPLDRSEIIRLLSLPVGSREYYELLWAANAYSRSVFHNRGVLFAQIGLDAQCCSVNCRFCSLAADARRGIPPSVKTLEETLALARDLAASGIEDLFLMTTAEFSPTLFLEYGRAVRNILPQTMRLVANTGDFDDAYAHQLRKAGFTGVYHIHRLREGVDTLVKPAVRIRTMDAVRTAGLELYYCVEPIGPEHTPDELADEILRMRDYPVGVMAVMKRIAVPGTPLFAHGEISAAALAKICAATTLAARPPRAMCVHEPDELCLMAGANQLYAECGVNPRDTELNTQRNRGFSVHDAQSMLKKADWLVTQ